MLNLTPLLDIKPYVPHFDNRESRTGWITESNHDGGEIFYSDDRF